MHQAEPGVGRLGAIEPGPPALGIAGLDIADAQQRHRLAILRPLRQHRLAAGPGTVEIVGQAQLPGLGKARVGHAVSR